MGNIKDRDRKLERQRTAAQIGFEDELRTFSKKKGYEILHLMRGQGLTTLCEQGTTNSWLDEVLRTINCDKCP